MASVKKITMREYNGTDYDTLYPKTIASQVDGVYTKEESISASTRTALSLAANATPDAALAKIAQQLSGILTVETISYTQMSSWVASGYALSIGNAYRLYDGTVILLANINTYGSLTRGKTIMTIPEGYRPNRQLKFCAITSASGRDEHPIAAEIAENGSIWPLVAESNSIDITIILYYPTGGVSGG